MTQADDALAKKRFFALSIMRLMGAAFAMIGFILISGGFTLAGQPTGRAGAELLDAGRAALLHGLRLTAGICAAVLLVVSGLVVMRLREPVASVMCFSKE